MKRAYWILVVLGVDSGRWELEFGDYEKNVVTDERDDHCESYSRKRYETRVIETTDDQADIDAVIDRLNYRRAN